MGQTLPINLVVDGRRCVVIGAGAASKVAMLEGRGGATVYIGADPPDEVRELAREGRIELVERAYEPGDLTGAFFAVCDRADPAVDAVASEAEVRQVLLNVVDDVGHSTAVFPAIVQRGALQIAISTEGRSPALAVRIKGEIASVYGPEYAELLEILGEARPLLAGWRTPEARAAAWRRLVDSELVDLVRGGRADEARERIREWLDSLGA